MCQHSLLPSSVSPGSERRGFVSSVYQGAPWGPAAAGGSERHPRVPSAALGPWQGPGQQWLPVMTATPGCLPPSWQPGDWGGGPASPPLVILQQGAFRPQGPGWATCFRLSIPLHPLPLPPLFPGCPWCQPVKKWEGSWGKGEPGRLCPGVGGWACVPRTLGQLQTPLCSRVAGCLSITKELLFKS